MMVAIKMTSFLSKSDMKRHMEYYHKYLESAPLAEGAQPLCFPGEIEHRSEAYRRKYGIPVPISTLEKLNQLGTEFGVAAELPR